MKKYKSIFKEAEKGTERIDKFIKSLYKKGYSDNNIIKNLDSKIKKPSWMTVDFTVDGLQIRDNDDKSQSVYIIDID